MKRCALTGHRVLPENFDKNALYDGLEELIRTGCDYFYCGMAEGFDLLALECLVALKQRYRITIEACIPFEGQEKHFSRENRALYRRLLDWCEQRTVIFPSYRGGCYLVRDRYMVDRADVLFAYCNRETGGAAYTVNYARARGVEVKLLT